MNMESENPPAPEPAPANALFADADVPKRRFTPAWSTLALVLGIALAVASLSVQPPRGDEIVPVDGEISAGDETTAEEGDAGSNPDLEAAGNDANGGDGPKGSAGTTVPGQPTRIAGQPGARPGQPGAAQVPADLACAAGKNGKNTDTGVTGTTIKLGSTVVQSGIGASFLGDVRFAMQAVVNKTNRAGGICGRQIRLKLVDDGWDYRLGNDFLRNLVEDEKVFALAVVPSSEGLKAISDAGYLAKHGVPAIGTDGMLIGQYTDPWIWPVAASTISTMHIMAKQAHDAGATKFGLVYETGYHFGIEGASAFNAAVKRLTGADIDGYSDPRRAPRCAGRFCGISASNDAYTTEIQTFNSACESCHFIGMLLEPTTAGKWMSGGGLRPHSGRRLGGVQPLFTADFAKECGSACHEMWLWTGYTPPLGDFLSRPAVATFVNDIKAMSSSADYTNSFVAGGYIGMQLVVKALQEVGPYLTRERIKQVLDSMSFDSGGLAPVLKWTPGNHFANTRMQAYSIQYKGGFNGWRDEQVSLEDPWVGQDG
ncbi:MAG TPA: ABC transporter substrate-binding protein [Acidimicrobiales bacterium]